MLGSTAGPAGGNTHRGLWPLAPAPAPPAPHLTAEGYSRYGVYSLFPGAGSPAPGVGVGAALYSHTSTIGRFAPGQAATPGQSSATTFHTAHKVTDSLFSTSNYTFGAPTPPPGSPYSPIPVAQLELLAKGITCSVSSVVQSNSSLSTTLKKSHSLSTSSDDKHPVRSLCEERCWVKSEKRSASSSCGCQPITASPSKTTKFTDNSSGCSRTNPVEWSPVSVKREPGATPCQVAEVTTSDVGSTSVVKVEATSPTSTARNSLPTPPTHHKQELPPQVSVPQSISNSNIPVGIAVARQRLHQDLTPSPSFVPPGLLAPIAPIQPIKEISSRISEIDTAPGMAATAATAGGATGGAILHCGDDRATGLATWPIGGAHGSALATPTLWQYPAHMPIEPMLPLPVPMPPVGFQLVRDPTSGHFLLIPTASLEQLQQAVVWPSYPQPSSHVLLPPLPPPPLAPLQLLSSASSDYLATSTTLHQHTQTHSTRLVAVTTDTKRKVPLPLPAHTLIKIEADCTATSTLDQTKAVQQTVSTVSSNTGTVFTDPSVTPLVTTHVFYQHPTNLILSQAPSAETPCKSQATSPVTCLTPPPEVLPAHEEENSLSVQDASNQTDTNIFVEEEQLIVAPEVTETSSPPLPKTPLKSDLEGPVVEQITSVPEPTPVSAQVYEKEPKSEEITKHVEAAVETNIASNKPDISGLELLSNSIVEFENSRQSAETTPIKYEPQHELKNERHEDCIIATGDDVLKGIAHMTLKDRESDCPKSTPVDDTLGGLGLLCALAEQRFMEEVAEKQAEPEVRQQPPVVKEYKKERRRAVSEERRKDKRRLKRCYEHGNESKIKRFKHDFDYDRRTEDEVINEREMEKIRENELELERERLSVLKRVAGERGLSEKGKRDLSYDLGITECDKRKTDKYRKDNDTKNNCSCKDERNNSKVYKETEKHNNNNNNNNGKIREWDMRQQLADLQRQCKEKQLELSKLTPKKSSECGDHFKKSSKPSKKQSPSPPPPLLDKMDTPPVIRHKGCPDLLKPPTLCAVIPTEDVKLPKCNVNLIKLAEVPVKTDIKFESPQKRKMSISHDSSDSTPEKISSSKKRKVGRPKKLMSAPGLRVATETIVAKKPRSKSSLVGYLLAAKNRLQMQNKNGLMYSKSSPPRYTEESPVTTPVKNKPKSHKTSKNTVIGKNPPATEYKKGEHKASKIRPKLKAEPKIKTYTEEEDCASEWEITSQVEEEEPQVPTPEPEPVAPAAAAAVAPHDTRCILTADHLSVDKLRVLTAMGGLFYAGQLTAIQAPDVYAITLDGERGNRPHIMSREEILRDAIVEVSPACTTELLPGTRLCAYWSQQYRCLYPGTVAEPGTPNPQLDMKFVCVEFDDGDSGRIALEDIRLLPADYPIIEYDPNPLLSLSKRRRRTSVNSVTEERRLNQTNTNTTPLASTPVAASVLPPEPPKSSSTPLAEKENTDMNRQSELDSHRERKRLKKRRKEKLKKLLCHEDKKKKRKHRCCDEHCKHRKHHKKHRKHKKHHHNRSETEESTEIAEQQQPVVPDEPEVTKIENSVEEEEEEDENVVPKKVEAKVKKSKKRKERRESVESRSKMAAFLPARQLWGWSGRGYKRVGVKGRARKQFFKAIQRGKESIMVGDCAVFLSTGRPDRPYIGKIEAMWESWGTNMVVRVKWFYHPEETVGCPLTLKYPGALFESPHVDENDVQTISHKCEVLPLKDYTDKLGPDLQRYETIYDNNDIYYLAGYYDPTTTTLTMQPDIPLAE